MDITEDIAAIRNETATLQGLLDNLSNLAYRLELPTSAATIRSMNTVADALRAEMFNLQKLIDEFPTE